ncbi:hypothetical protein RBWH47_04912 [Rhodopirellula baltica WH47]|uniref:Uncharacterized protein n=1 Tax=Rhodopirellula baltica WH47 TaxID=991778 RepID=F2ANB7_RHOBT|nr:hypothetical protein RBWH47_04912 [Rhodopirellula baltica WH47]
MVWETSSDEEQTATDVPDKRVGKHRGAGVSCLRLPSRANTAISSRHCVPEKQSVRKLETDVTYRTLTVA